MRRTIKAVLVALAIAVPAVLVPAVSASAASNPDPSCGQSTCAPSTSTLQPKDPSQDVAPPNGTIPLTAQSCDPGSPCTQINDPGTQQPPASTVTINQYDEVQYQLDQTRTQLDDAQYRAFILLITDVLLLIAVIVLLIITMASRRPQPPQVIEPAKAGPIFH